MSIRSIVLGLTLIIGVCISSRAVAQSGLAVSQTTSSGQVTLTAGAAITSTGAVTSSAEATTTAVGAQLQWYENLLPSDPDDTRRILLTAIAGATIGALVTLVVVFAKQIGRGLGIARVWLWKRFRVERALEGNYREKLGRELRLIQILHMTEGKNLESFYIPLRLASWIEPDLIDEDSPAPDTPVDFHEVLERYAYIAIVGNPGAGKTTITCHAAAAVADASLQINGKRYLPIYVQLRRLRDFLQSKKWEEKSLMELASDLLEAHDFPEPQKYLKRKLDAGECLIILDGFDEIADRDGTLQQRLANKTRDLVGAINEGNRIVLTSRSAGYMPAWFAGFRVFEMTDLSPDQAKQFVDRWFGTFYKKQALELEKAIDESDRLQLLVANPLMLAIVCFVFGTKQPGEEFLPRRRVDLYERCIHALIVEWDSSRGVKRDSRFEPWQIKTVLYYVAFDALLNEKIDFTRKDLLASVRSNLPRANRQQYEDEVFLDEVLAHTGLFRHKGHDTYGFLHLTFHEYLAAKVIEQKVLDGVTATDVRGHLGEVLQNAINPAWGEPIALAAGIMRHRTELVDVLYEYAAENPGRDIEIVLQMCLRDADLEDFSFSAEYLARRDELVSSLVVAATEVSTQ